MENSPILTRTWNSLHALREQTQPRIKSASLLFVIAAAVFVCFAAERPFASAQEEGQASPQQSVDPAEKPGSADGPANESAKAGNAAAKQTLELARDRLVKYRSLKAELTETVLIGDRKFKTTGVYLQGSTLKLRLEFHVQLGDSTASLLEVCDGQVLWTRHTIGKESRISRRDVTQILEAAGNNPNIAESRLIAELGLGGLPALLASIDSTIAFETAKEEEIDGTLFTVIEGTWNQDYLTRLQAAGGDSAELPPYVPDRVRIYFQHENLFPRRILYLKKNPSAKTYRPMVKLDFEKVRPDVPVKDEDFYFVPPDRVQVEDITKSYIRQLTGPARSPATQQDGTN